MEKNTEEMNCEDILQYFAEKKKEADPNGKMKQYKSIKEALEDTKRKLNFHHS